MSNLFFVGSVTLLLIVVYTTLVLLNTYSVKSKKKKTPQHYVDTVDSLNVSPEEFYKVLNFMLMYGIIDLETYNNIHTKGLPYTG